MISVVIPTYQNEPILMKCLDALARQDFPMSGLEVVVVVDGSTDATVASLAARLRSAPFRLVCVTQPNQGPGPARNHGIRRAAHDLILIINDDLIASPGLVRAHADWHARHPERTHALLGGVEEPQNGINGLVTNRLAKAFAHAQALEEASWDCFWTTNISLKKSFLVETGQWFSDAFPYPVHEDVEMGYRLGRRGLRLFSEPKAKGVHMHVMDYAQFARRAYQSGVCLSVFYRLHPELKDFLSGKGLVCRETKPWRALAADAALNAWTVGALERTAHALARWNRHGLAERCFDRLLGYHQRRGVKEALSRRGLHARREAPAT
ncbi:MAG TPA: hypothetical protein DEB40_14635 [Elusimicrobia bacterium]|nr:hypothetical protein [Elusimicrobiota bacterium]HBT62971.1 hypothetical protein [Elusimicrobiota bacterium]